MTTEFKFTYETILPNDRYEKELSSGPAIWQMLSQEEWTDLPWMTMTFLLPLGTEFTSDILDTLNIEVNMINKWATNHQQPYRNVIFWSRELPLPNTEWAVALLPSPLHVPDTPMAPTVIAGFNKVTVSVIPPNDGGNVITDYIWQVSVPPYDVWTDADDGNMMSVPEATLVGPAIVTGVVGKVRVAAINRVGISSFSEPSEEVIILGPPVFEPDAPGAPTVEAGIESVTATTIAPNDGGSPILDYSWQYAVGDFTEWVDYVDDISNIPEVTLIEMVGGVVGKIRVAAVNAIGQGEFSEPSVEVTVLSAVVLLVPDAPIAPTVTSSPNTIIATTIPPADGGSPITDYSWQYAVGDFTTWIDYADIAIGLPEITMIDIPDGTIGKVRVAAINAIGIGPFSEPSEIVEIPTTPVITVPEIPIAPTASAGDPGMIVVNVIAPNDGGSPITDYLWQVSVPPYDVWTDSTDEVGAIQDSILGPFGSGVTGKARVAAINAIGQSGFSEPSNEVITV